MSEEEFMEMWFNASEEQRKAARDALTFFETATKEEIDSMFCTIGAPSGRIETNEEAAKMHIEIQKWMALHPNCKTA